jgi:hypothetical protein
VPPDPALDQEGVMYQISVHTEHHHFLPGIGYEEPIAAIPDRIFGTSNIHICLTTK